MAENYKTDVKKYESILGRSNTAYTPNVSPSSSDIRAEMSLMKAKKAFDIAEGERLKSQYYDDEETDKKKSAESYLGRALKIINMPMSAGAGVAEHVLGKGSKGTLGANIIANVKEQGNYGDILRSYGANNVVAMPLGLALDIALDPINWATAGTAALIPRVGVGLAKAGTEGAVAGLKSGLASKVETISRLPGLSGKTAKAFEKNSLGDYVSDTRTSNAMRLVSKTSAEDSLKFDNLIGNTFSDKVKKAYESDSWFQKAENILDQSSTGRKINQLFKYDPQGHVIKDMDKADELRAVEMTDEDVLASLDGTFKPARDMNREVADAIDVMNDPALGTVRSSLEGSFKGTGEKSVDDKVKGKFLEDMGEIYKALSGIKHNLDGAIWDKISNLNFDDQKSIVSIFNHYKSGYKDYDAYMAKKLTSPKGRAVLNNYAKAIGIFKGMKIGGNLPSSGMNALAGNLVMTGMSGIDITNAAFHSSLSKAVTMVRGKNKDKMFKLISEVNNNKDWNELITKYPDVFESAFGINPKLFTEGENYIEELVSKNIGPEMSKILMEGKDMLDPQNIKNLEAVQNMWRETIGKSLRQSGVNAATAENAAVRTNVSQVAGITQRGATPMSLTGEIMDGPYQEFLKMLESNKDNKFAQGLNWFLTKPMDAYSKIDSTYRLGLALHLTEDGISEKEMLKLIKRVNIPEEAITKVPDSNLYKIKPKEAILAASEIYMNYSAMPGAVKIMRSIPILGSPFFAFMYGMTSIAAKTAKSNPSYFNKVQFFLKEMEGEKSPIEKDLLANSEYYKWFNQAGMTKLPFFRENPVYMNMSNWIPYYSMNILQPSERSYNERFGGAAAKLIDQVPFLKTPEGQVMFDYFIQPMILQDEDPRGMFDQRLWSKDAKFPEKAGKAILSLADAFTPPAVGAAAGLAVGATTAKDGIADATTPYIPSYKYRSMINAVRGKNPTGIPTVEPASIKTIRNISQTFGMPTYQMNKTFYKPKDK